VELICTQARQGTALGSRVEIPDGATWSEVYFAEPGTPEALRAQQDAADAAEAPEPPSDPPGAPQDIVVPPDGTEAG
jgi:hypothetical protein